MPSQSISPLYCLCGWQMTELDLSVIRWGGKIASPSPLLAPQHILSSSVSWVALFLSDVSLSVKSFSYISSSLAISHPSTFLISYFLHDTTPFISLIQSGLHSCFTQVKADIFFLPCWKTCLMLSRSMYAKAGLLSSSLTLPNGYWYVVILNINI